VRVTRWPNGTAAATIRSLRYRDDLKRELSSERAVIVSPEDAQALEAAFSETDYWKLTTPWYIKGSTGIDAIPLCVDSTLLAIEAISDGRYHIVLRGCGRKEEIARIVEVMKRIARLYLPKDVDEYVP
jgi:hypothetical protein